MGRAALVALACAAGAAPSCARPDYGDAPFLCGSLGECPSGYSCMQDICIRDGARVSFDAIAPDASASGGGGGSGGGRAGADGANAAGGASGGARGNDASVDQRAEAGGQAGRDGAAGSAGSGGAGGGGGAAGAGGAGGTGGGGGMDGGSGRGTRCQTGADCAPPLACCFGILFNVCDNPTGGICIPVN